MPRFGLRLKCRLPAKRHSLWEPTCWQGLDGVRQVHRFANKFAPTEVAFVERPFVGQLRTCRSQLVGERLMRCIRYIASRTSSLLRVHWANASRASVALQKPAGAGSFVKGWCIRRRLHCQASPSRINPLPQVLWLKSGSSLSPFSIPDSTHQLPAALDLSVVVVVVSSVL